MSNYDAWLEAPYQRLQEQGEAEVAAREQLADELGLGMDDPALEEAWDNFVMEEGERVAAAQAEDWYARSQAEDWYA